MRWQALEADCAGGDDLACIYLAHAKWSGCCLPRDRDGGRVLYLRSCPDVLTAVRRARTLSTNDVIVATSLASVYCPEADESTACQTCRELGVLGIELGAKEMKLREAHLPPCPSGRCDGYHPDRDPRETSTGTRDVGCPPLPDDAAVAHAATCRCTSDVSVRLGPILGDTDEDQRVRRAIRTRLPAMEYCIAVEESGSYALAGPALVEMRGEGGRVVSRRVAAGGRAEVEMCIANAVGEIDLPERPLRVMFTLTVEPLDYD